MCWENVLASHGGKPGEWVFQASFKRIKPTTCCQVTRPRCAEVASIEGGDVVLEFRAFPTSASHGKLARKTENARNIGDFSDRVAGVDRERGWILACERPKLVVCPRRLHFSRGHAAHTGTQRAKSHAAPREPAYMGFFRPASSLFYAAVVCVRAGFPGPVSGPSNGNSSVRIASSARLLATCATAVIGVSISLDPIPGEYYYPRLPVWQAVAYSVMYWLVRC